MPVYQLERTQVVKLPLQECWRFFADPRNLEKITPRSMKFRVRSELPATIRPGLMIAYTVSPVLEIPLSWLTEITAVEAPNYFCDEQRAGPYKVWHHEHFFRGVSERETEVRDHIHYVPPFGPLGAIINAMVVRRQLTKIFDYRAKVMAEFQRACGT